jgi:hypothetical protein
MYVDESGDPGLVNSPTRYFALSGIVIHEMRWNSYLEQLVDFRKRINNKFGLKLREEIHASEMLNHPKKLARIPKYERLAIIRMCADELSSMSDLSIINVLNDKSTKSINYDVFEMSWTALLQRFENTIRHHNFPGPRNSDEGGIIIPDNTDNKKLIHLMRKMRRYNPVPNQSQHGIGYRNLQIKYILEDANFRDSRDSYLVQAADTAAFLLYQMECPNKYIRSKSGHKYFSRLAPILCKVACPSDPYGIVRL